MEWGPASIRALKSSVVAQDYPYGRQNCKETLYNTYFSTVRWKHCFALEPILMAFVSCNVPSLLRYFHLGKVFLCDLCIG
jgi:hypothetical protein